jgi:protein SCO1/2
VRRTLAWGLLAAATAFAFVLFLREERVAGRAARSPQVLGTVPHFALVESGGTPFGLGDLAGSPWIADFVFTRCRMSCPLLTRKMLELRGRLPASTRARLVSVSVDPEHDSPEVLRRYAAENGIDGPGWVFLTGTRADVRRLVREGFHLPVEDTPDDPASPILHADRFVLVDGEARVRGYYAALEPEELDRLLADLERVEAEGSR